ncbi:hypothetical protein NUW58_g6618 [Xylaria curta]|uniref:Uncharacterized protein n=1 Tax=Xylaria curta TaxID=42375 RepID=A0ACC1NS70_9PEZI|nr:hypothetical protein NUW58_g6618 [Xylaria curta]
MAQSTSAYHEQFMMPTSIKSEIESKERQLQKLKDTSRIVDQIPDGGLSKEYHQALLGVEISQLDQQAATLQEQLLDLERPILKKKEYKKRHNAIIDRKFSAGDKLWDYTKKKSKIDNPGSINIFHPGCEGAKVAGECLLNLYRSLDGVKRKKCNKRPSTWRKEVEEYYDGACQERKGRTWCHASGVYVWDKYAVAAHIVPFFLHAENIGSEMFGSRGVELEKPSNALLLKCQIKDWFDKYCVVIVPVDRAEVPITRWKIQPLGSSVTTEDFTEECSPGLPQGSKWIHSKELTFLNDARPASRFLYFHFIMALVRARDADLPGWKNEWARFFVEQPFPTPGSYLRNSMLIAINQHFGVPDAKLLENWIQGQGFEAPITLSPEEVEIVASRVKAAAESVQIEEEEEEEEEDEDDEDEDEDDEDEDEDDEEGEEEEDNIVII